MEKNNDDMYSVDKLIAISNFKPDEIDSVAKKSRKLLTSRLTKFKLKKNETFAPPLHTTRSLARIPINASLLAQKLKRYFNITEI
jgi:hypothetical protein